MSTSMNSGNRRSVAFCFYGQYRTADYCLPWLKAMVEAVPNTKVVCCSTKLLNSYPNSTSNTQTTVSLPSSMRESLTAAFPRIQLHISDSVHQDCAPRLGHWSYSRMFWSMNKSLQLYNEWGDLNKTDVDLIVLARLDTLVGPTPESLSQWIKSVVLDDFGFYTQPGIRQFTRSEFGLGVGDLLLAGSPYAMNCVLSYAMAPLISPTNESWSRWLFGPNVMLKRAADQSSLRLYPIDLQTAIVRPSNLTAPVMSSFDSHHHHWHQDHKALKGS